MTPVHPDTLAALTSGIQSEVAAYVFYREASKKDLDQETRAIVEKLALEEKEHFQVLERQYDSLVRSEKWITTADALRPEGLPEIEEEMTRQHQGLIDEVAQADTTLAVLEIALRLEIEAKELFAGAAERSDSEEGKKVFERLARFEEGHEKLIQKIMANYR